MTEKTQVPATRRHPLAEVKEAVRAHVWNPTKRNAENAKRAWRNLQAHNKTAKTEHDAETRRDRPARGIPPSPALPLHCGAGPRRDQLSGVGGAAAMGAVCRLRTHRDDGLTPDELRLARVLLYARFLGLFSSVTEVTLRKSRSMLVVWCMARQQTTLFTLSRRNGRYVALEAESNRIHEARTLDALLKELREARNAREETRRGL